MTKAQQRKQEGLDLISRMYLAGSSREEIAAASGYKIRTVGIYLSEMGLLHKDPEGSRQLEKIIRMWDDGRKLWEIRDATGLSEGRISQILAENGRRRRHLEPYGIRETETEGMINEHTVFADDTPRIYRFRIKGKEWIDITELFGR